MLELKLNTEEQFLAELICHESSLDKDKLSKLFHLIGEESSYELCQTNGITSIAYYSLIQCEGIEMPRRWSEAFEKVEQRVSEYMQELDRAAGLLSDHGIALVALKNSGIARAIYPVCGASPMGDLDVLVDKKDFRKAHGILLGNGYDMRFRSPLESENIDSAERNGGAEYSVHLTSGNHLWFELQWRPIAGRWIRVEQEPRSTDLIERSKSIPGSKVKILAPEDNLMQVALHTAKHTYVRAPGFRLHTDVDRIVRATSINWTEFSAEAKRLKVKTAVHLSLYLANTLLRTPVPQAVLDATAPSKLKKTVLIKWLLKVGLFYPNEKKWSRLGYIAFVALLYDDFFGLMNGIFPPLTYIKIAAAKEKKSVLRFYYDRIIDLVKNRVIVR